LGFTPQGKSFLLGVLGALAVQKIKPPGRGRIPAASFNPLSGVALPPRAFQRALGEVDGLAAGGTLVGLVELVGEDLVYCAALGAVALHGAQGLEVLESGAMLGCGLVFRGHDHSPCWLVGAKGGACGLPGDWFPSKNGEGKALKGTKQTMSFA
jgi:hypothetical protein